MSGGSVINPIMEVVYRQAVMEDLQEIANFTDFWLGGLGISAKVPGAGHDFFIPKGRHADYIRKQVVFVAIYCDEIVAWAVKSRKGVLIHLLIAGTFRDQGIGKRLLGLLKPDVIRSKSDQSTGDPGKFYESQGYVRQSPERVGRKKNIEIYIRSESKSDKQGRKLEGKQTFPDCSAAKNSDISASENWGLDLPAESSALGVEDWV